METTILLAITIVLWGAFHNFSRLALKSLPPSSIPIIFSICSLASVPLYHYLMLKSPIKWSWNWSGIGWAIAAYICTAGGSLAYMFVLSKANVSSVVGISTSYPIITMIIAVLFMGEAFSASKFIGALLILAGIFVSTK